MSYFIGILFYIYCYITKDVLRSQLRLSSNIIYTEIILPEDSEWDGEPNFIDRWLTGKTSYERAILMTYYAFTSLSTVGFGDIHPTNNAERCMVAFILLFGVAIFSYVMGNFIDILDTFKSINAQMEDGDNLSKFFGLIKQFNKGRMIDYKMKCRMEDFMEYRW